MSKHLRLLNGSRAPSTFLKDCRPLLIYCAGSPDYHCYCYDGFYGRNCTLYDPCFSAPCQNNAQCRNLSDTAYSCRCRAGFHGVNCQLYNPCADSPCLHAGMCNSIDGRFVCDCEPGYFGSVAAASYHYSRQERYDFAFFYLSVKSCGLILMKFFDGVGCCDWQQLITFWR